jgi:hypothetical protein
VDEKAAETFSTLVARDQSRPEFFLHLTESLREAAISFRERSDGAEVTTGALLQVGD